MNKYDLHYFRMNATMIRRTTVTTLAQKCPAMKKPLAIQMCHSDVTQDIQYQCLQNTQQVSIYTL